MVALAVALTVLRGLESSLTNVHKLRFASGMHVRTFIVDISAASVSQLERVKLNVVNYRCQWIRFD